MSVIVMGVDIPEDCDSCWLPGKHCNLWLATDVGERHRGCPLRPLPEKHGRLIDGDELADGCDDPHWCRWLSEIEDMPTIVEAEGE